jgi:hypothetical protein
MAFSLWVRRQIAKNQTGIRVPAKRVPLAREAG